MNLNCRCALGSRYVGLFFSLFLILVGCVEGGGSVDVINQVNVGGKGTTTSIASIVDDTTTTTPVYALVVNKTGTGSGTVVSLPAGINCGADCREDYPHGTLVMLTAAPDSNSIFTGWSGDPDCANGSVTMTADKACTAAFNIMIRTLTVTKTGTGSGTVTSQPTGINCGADCTENYLHDTVVTLVATPSADSIFTGWSGACTGTGECVVNMHPAKSVTATFNIMIHTLTVTKVGTGSGTVRSNPAGIDCGADCAEDYAHGTFVTLTPTPDTGSTFAGWSGACTGTGGCIVEMHTDKFVMATFNLILHDITVNTTDDELNADGDCSLREAIQAANTDSTVDACPAGNGADTINVPAGTYLLSMAGAGEDANVIGDLDITSDMTIIGAGATNTIIDGNRLDRVFHIVNGTVEISGVTVQNGSADAGGGINNQGALALNNSTISGNAGSGNFRPAFGGGISNQGMLIINNSVISGNSVIGIGGGINNCCDSLMILTNSTVSNNSDYGIHNQGPATLTNVTISGNYNGGIWHNPPNHPTLNINNSTINDKISVIGHRNDQVILKNTIIAHCNNPINSAGHNMDVDNTCGLIGPGDLPGADPLLGLLADNGGHTQTHALLPGSPAINAGSPDCPPPDTDQRSIARPQDGACDIGAFEFESVTLQDTWLATTLASAPEGRSGHTVVWTDSKMLVWGGANNSGYLNTGGIYDPVTNSWAEITTTGAPEGRSGHTAVWTGSKMLVWGGADNSGYLNTGGIYDPATDSWTEVATTGAPAWRSGRSGHTAVWTGSKMLVWVWNGENSSGFLNTGGVYDLATNSWAEITTTGAPAGRSNHTAVWTGSKMLIWGGYSGSTEYSNTGGIYDPATDSWAEITTNGAPAGRSRHTAVWTGSKMLVWGGFGWHLSSQGGGSTGHFNTGGIYDPVTNSWTEITTNGAPESRGLHTVIWTGSKMLVWGGFYLINAGRGGAGYFNTGGVYDLATDSWTEITTNGAPAGRVGHTAVWTGSKMLVWGGGDNAGYLNTGGIYQ